MKNKALGISVFPEKNSFSEIKEYLKLTSSYGFSKLFLNFLQITKENKKEIISKYSEIIKEAKKYNFLITLDVAEDVYNVLEIKNHDSKFFHELGVDVLRLDLNENGFVEKEILNNPYNISLEINGSSTKGVSYLLNELGLSKNRVIVSHNFYPQRFTGLPLDYFVENTLFFKNLGYKTSAFINSKDGKIFPWAESEGCPTLEIHRDLDIDVQAKHFYALGIIDELVISNCFASERELKKLSEINPSQIELSVELEPAISDSEKDVLLNYLNHFRRGDINEYTVRSTMPRIHYKDSKFPVRKNSKSQSYGDVYVANDSAGRYKAELFILIKNHAISNDKNLVAKVVEEEKFLIKYISGWKNFKFKVR